MIFIDIDGKTAFSLLYPSLNINAVNDVPCSYVFNNGAMRNCWFLVSVMNIFVCFSFLFHRSEYLFNLVSLICLFNINLTGFMYFKGICRNIRKRYAKIANFDAAFFVKILIFFLSIFFSVAIYFINSDGVLMFVFGFGLIYIISFVLLMLFNAFIVYYFKSNRV